MCELSGGRGVKRKRRVKEMNTETERKKGASKGTNTSEIKKEIGKRGCGENQRGAEKKKGLRKKIE